MTNKYIAFGLSKKVK